MKEPLGTIKDRLTKCFEIIHGVKMDLQCGAIQTPDDLAFNESCSIDILLDISWINAELSYRKENGR
jgi:hypothetical protein